MSCFQSLVLLSKRHPYTFILVSEHSRFHACTKLPGKLAHLPPLWLQRCSGLWSLNYLLIPSWKDPLISLLNSLKNAFFSGTNCLSSLFTGKPSASFSFQVRMEGLTMIRMSAYTQPHMCYFFSTGKGFLGNHLHQCLNASCSVSPWW